MKRPLLIILLSLLCACNSNKKDDSETIVINPIPKLYINGLNPAMQKINDVVYYKTKKFDGYVYELYSSKDTIYVKSYVNGIEEGVHKKWYPNKQLSEQRFYHNGKKEGTHKAWWENGKLQYEYQISNDEYTGEYKEWNPNGKLLKIFHYKNGQEDGSQKLFYDNGSIRANYVIIKGRRFGLLGTKNCKNVKDSLNL